MKKLFWLLVALMLAAGGYYGYTRWGSTEQTLQLVTATVSRGDVVQSVDATGRLEAVTTVLVGSQVSGTISALYADFNSTVRAGQVVARLEPSLFETQVEQARASLLRLQAEVERARVQFEDAQVKLARARDLTAKQLVPSTDLETAEANARAAAAALKGAEAQVVQSEASLNQSQVNLSHTVITAPIDGVVISRNVDVGQTVAASMSAPTLFEIANDLAQMQVSASIDEADIGLIMPGEPATFRVDAYPDETFTGTVSQVRLNPVIESNVVSYVTIIDVPNEDLRLRPGMTATVTVEVARASDTLRVPSSALRFAPTPELFAALGQTDPHASAAPAGEDALGRADVAEVPAGEGTLVNQTASEGFAGGRGGLSAVDRAALAEQLSQMSADERQAAFAARRGRGQRGFAQNGGRGRIGAGNGERPGGAAAARQADGSRGQIWAVVDGQLTPVAVRTGISDGANVAIASPELQEAVVVATGMIRTTAAASPATGNPLLPRFGRFRGGGGGGGRGGR